MRLHDEFEWDSRKAAANWRKHRVTFDEAEVVLGDEEGDVYHVEEPDEEHGEGEDRYITTGSLPTDRSTTRRRITRIISARRATNEERRRYGQDISGQ